MRTTNLSIQNEWMFSCKRSGNDDTPANPTLWLREGGRHRAQSIIDISPIMRTERKDCEINTSQWGQSSTKTIRKKSLRVPFTPFHPISLMRWTTEAQLAWLDSRCNDYLDAKSHGIAEREAFLNRCYDDFVAEWPLSTVVFSPDVGSEEDSSERIRLLRETALRAVRWFLFMTSDDSSKNVY